MDNYTPLQALGEYLTKDDLANLLRVSKRTINNYISEKRLPEPIHIGRRALWDKAALAEFLKRGACE
ncbi:helix-turn-helix transcriptional regulator [Acidovorax sp. K2F]|uniref:helix-turn-helix transcriptional regulator n=1 Tax=Acidovorax sp. K2F TaxID=2978125 RepID=UPI00391BAD35